MESFKPWKIVHIELDKEFQALSIEPDIGGLFTVFWYRGIPLGQQIISAAELPMPTSQVLELGLKAITPAVGDRLFEQGLKVSLADDAAADPSGSASLELGALIATERPLQKLWKCLSQTENGVPHPSISVVICTRDRPEQLERCLRSLQELSQLPYEILVVDNAPSSDATRRLVNRLGGGIRYVLEPRAGLGVARNTGIRHSCGDIVAFTDDDVVVHVDWIRGLQYGFKNPGVMAVTGLVLPAELETEAQFIFETCWGFNKGYCSKTFDAHFFETTRRWGIPSWEIGAGANMALRRQVFKLISDFDERLGAGVAGCSEDSELWYRLLAKGFICLYEPSAAVYHYHRRDIDGLNQQLYYYMRGHVAALLIQFERHRHWGNLRRLLFFLPKYYLKLFLLGSLRGFKFRYRTLLAETTGGFSGVKFYLFNRRSHTLR